MGDQLVAPGAAEAGQDQRGERPEGREGRHLEVADHLVGEREQARHDHGRAGGAISSRNGPGGPQRAHGRANGGAAAPDQRHRRRRGGCDHRSKPESATPGARPPASCPLRSPAVALVPAMSGSVTGQRRVPTRRVDFQDRFEHLPRHFAADGDLIISHLAASFSSVFPDGEEFFVRAVRRFRGQISDGELAGDVAGFIGQESTHGRQHRLFNERLSAHSAIRPASTSESPGAIWPSASDSSRPDRTWRRWRPSSTSPRRWLSWC